ncbi:MAG: serine hydrolase [Clostridiales bacterium]|nr:serine hydrolase [Clostridiales bacterium]
MSELEQMLGRKVVQHPCEADPEAVGYDSGRLHVLNDHIQQMIDEKMILSGSYCLWRKGKVFADVSLGNLACEWQGRTRFLPDTFFELQSVTKVFTAIAILKLAEDGILYLGQPVCEWIEEFNIPDFRNITILHLLTHTSGLCALPGVLPEDERRWWEAMDENRVGETWIPAVIQTGLQGKPGEKWIYSAVGYPLLGEILQRATGKKAEEYIREEIFLPCQMKETHWRVDAKEEWLPRYNIANETDLKMVKEYQKIGKKAMTKPSYLWWDEVPNTAGGVMSTGREMVRLGEMLLRDGYYRGKRIIGKIALSRLWTNQVGEQVLDWCWGHPGNPVVYGAGMPISTHGSDREQLISDSVIYHEGSGACVFLVDKKEDFVAVYQTSFPKEEGWSHRAVKATASIIWSGIR